MSPNMNILTLDDPEYWAIYQFELLSNKSSVEFWAQAIPHVILLREYYV